MTESPLQRAADGQRVFVATSVFVGPGADVGCFESEAAVARNAGTQSPAKIVFSGYKWQRGPVRDSKFPDVWNQVTAFPLAAFRP